MSQIKISELEELTEVANDDLLVIVDSSSNETKKVKAENVGTGGGGASSDLIVVGELEDVKDETKLLIEKEELSNLGSEVVDTLNGNETNKAPSVRAVNEVNSYSTEEKVVGTWVDNKTLYQKTYKVKSPNATGTGTNILDLTSLNYEFIRITNADFFYESFYGPANYFVNSTDYAALWIRPYNKNVACIIGNDTRKNQDIYITLEYTKTTD